MKKLLLLDTTLVELFMGVVAILWGVWVALPFDIFYTSPVYYAMTKMAPEIVWGLMFVFFGGVLLIAVIINMPAIKRFRLYQGMSAIWIFLASAFVLGNWRSTATPIYNVFAITAVITAIILCYQGRRYA